MLATIHFDYQPPPEADEIYDVASNWLLPSEFELIEPPTPKDAPQTPLCIGEVFPESSGSS